MMPGANVSIWVRGKIKASGDIWPCRFLAEDVLDQLGVAVKNSADIVGKIAEAYLEELKLLGGRCNPASPPPPRTPIA